MLRKRHLLAGSHYTFDPSQQLVRSDFQIFPWGALVTIRWSKTIQFRERVVQIPLPLIPDSPLCPVIAIQRAFSFVRNVPLHSQAFMWQDAASLRFKIFTYSKFLQRLRSAFHALGLPARDYACHSFQRGGASFAFQAGLPVELIKILGDWHSRCCSALPYGSTLCPIRIHQCYCQSYPFFPLVIIIIIIIIIIITIINILHFSPH